MALRLIEILLHENDAAEIHELLKEHNILEYKQIRLSDDKTLVRILLDAEQSEAVLDILENQCASDENRAVVLPVEATLPRAEPEAAAAPEKSPERISREELYEDIKDAAGCSRIYLAMAVLSTIVASVGLHDNSVAIIIGAMVIAPMLGPSMALGLGTTLGDRVLLRRAFLTGLAGIATTVALSVVIGIFMHVDPTLTEVASRTRVELGDIAVALASGCAGALAFTTRRVSDLDWRNG